MIRSQQSGDENQGFFKPLERVVQFKNEKQNPVLKDQKDLQANSLVQKARPKDYNARIINQFNNFNEYNHKLLVDRCQQKGEQLINLSNEKQKKSKKYMTLQQKYLNNETYEMVFCKLKNPKEFNSYIFSLDHLIDYNQNNYTKAQQISLDLQQRRDIQLKLEKHEQFKFDSNFQSGNLLYAFKNKTQKQIPTFDLIIQNDTNTKGYNQWFYFSITKNYNLTKFKGIKINIVNFIKKHLMFQNGVRPVGMLQSEGQWKFIGKNIQYKKSYMKRYIQFNGCNMTKNYYTLSLTLDFPEKQLNQKDKKLAQASQTVYVALNYPYPYKRVINLIDSIQQQSSQISEIQVKKETLCYTISNNQIPYLTLQYKPTQKQMLHHIKSKRIQKNQKKQKQQQIKKSKSFIEDQFILEEPQIQISDQQVRKQISQKKKKIFIIGRQHPGQTVGSFVLQAFLQQLITGIKNQHFNSKTCKQNNLKLLKQYSIYVFPMVNVDGVIYGNFRTNLAGFDLNRQWIDPNRWLHPEIYHLKKFIASLKNIQFVLDFHGHSRKLNSFIYACNNPVPILQQSEDESNYPNISMFRLFPFIFSQQCQFFSIKDCTYTTSRDKIKTARINTFKYLKYNPYIFTLQTGFYGYSKEDKNYRYKISDFFKIGKGALQSVKTILLKSKKVKQILKEVEAKSYLFDMWSYENKEDPGSQSNPSEDQLSLMQIKTKVLSDQKAESKERKQQEKERANKQQEAQSKKRKKRQKNMRQFKKASTEMKSQKLIVKNQEEQGKKVQKKQVNEDNIQQQKQKNLKTKNEKSKQIKIQYLPQKKIKDNEEMFSVVAVKQAKIKKPDCWLPYPNYRERVQSHNKKNTIDEFKSSSNLLGTGIAYFNNKNSKLAQLSNKTNPNTLQMLQINNIRKDVRIQSFSSPSQPSTQNITSKPSQNSFFKDNQIKDFFYSLNRQSQKNSYEKKSHRQRIYVVRENKIVKIVNNVNKNKSVSQKSGLEDQIRKRQQNLKQCQEMMRHQSKGLINEIKDQMSEQKKRKKRVYLHPIEY